MKFCKNLTRIANLADQSNPEWSPYWVNYKGLKKLIMALPSLLPDDLSRSYHQIKGGNNNENSSIHPYQRECCDETSCTIQQSHSESLSGEIASETEETSQNKRRTKIENTNMPLAKRQRRDYDCDNHDCGQNNVVQKMMSHPGEIAFFRLLHSELHKAQHFFDGAQKELLIREERIQESIRIVKSLSPSSEEAWSNVFRSLYKLNTKLLLLETYAIMSFCAFSKILKKHDKVTGFNTRLHFMEKLVKTSNFADYPELQEMTSRCKRGVKEVLYSYSKLLGQRRKKNNLFEDEHLFIHMVEKLNDQARETAVEEGASNVELDPFSRKNQNKASLINIENVTTSKSKLASYIISIVDQYGRGAEEKKSPSCE